MERSLILETTFLVDLERERRAGLEGYAHAFLSEYAESRLFVTETIAGEIAAGASMSKRTVWEAYLMPFAVLPMDRDVSWHYGRIYRYLQSNGMLIGANDLWIAATARSHECPIVTRDVDHYKRVPDLEVIGYGDAS